MMKYLIDYLEDSIAECEGYAEDDDYDDIERHDSCVVAETYKSVLNFLEGFSSGDEYLIDYLEDSIAECEGYAEDDDYDDIESHDSFVAAETYREVLRFVEKNFETSI